MKALRAVREERISMLFSADLEPHWNPDSSRWRVKELRKLLILLVTPTRFERVTPRLGIVVTTRKINGLLSVCRSQCIYSCLNGRA